MRFPNYFCHFRRFYYAKAQTKTVPADDLPGLKPVCKPVFFLCQELSEKMLAGDSSLRSEWQTGGV